MLGLKEVYALAPNRGDEEEDVNEEEEAPFFELNCVVAEHL